MIIDTVYNKLHENHLCSSAYDFSTRFLGKSKGYYGVLKSRKSTPSIEVVATLETALKKTSFIYNNSKFTFFSKKHDFLCELTNEVSSYREQLTDQLLQ